MLLYALIACQAPFAEDRHDLASFRIAAASAHDDGVTTALRAFIWSGRGAWHPTAPRVVWTLTTADGAQTVEGARVDVPVTGLLGIALEASDDDGHVERATVDPAQGELMVDDWTRSTVSLTGKDAAQPIEARAAAALGEGDTAAPDGALRLSVTPSGPATVHFMATAGHFAEIDPTTTDWFAADVTLDDGELVAHTPLAAGVYPLAALAFDGVGNNAWTWIDAAVDPGPTLRVDGRILPVDLPLDPAGEGLWSATFTPTDDVLGFRLDDLALVDTPDSDAACGQPAGALLDLGALAEGACGRDELEGRRVTLLGEVIP